MLLWLITAGAALTALATVGLHRLIVHREQHTLAPSLHHNPGICFYLHEQNVMNLYLQGDYEALTQEVEETYRSSNEASLKGKLPGVDASAGQETEKEKISRYIRHVGPITVIGRIVNALEKAGNIVYVDLFNKTIEPGTGLDHALRSTYGKNAARRRSVRLRDLNPFVFVSVMGRFRVTEKNDETTIFSAPYGDPADPDSEPNQVTVTCVSTHFLEAVPSGPFPARCLGRIQKWDPDNQKLVLDPVLAIFQ